ncbi:MAG TPA: glycosyl hydrolase [Kineosporiaceae bacterium]|nr:glycosyl hydrolase [Kineosporiaceae bacterium]
MIVALIAANIALFAMNSDRDLDVAAPRSAALIPSPAGSAPPVTYRTTSTRLGVFVGANRADVTKFEKWLGRRVKDVLHFDGRETWAQITHPKVAQWRGSSYRLILGVPMLPDTEKSRNEQAMRAGARGKYDSHFTTLAKNLVAAGQSDAVLRIGWEFNLKSRAWGISDHEVFKRYFRRIATAMRAVPGAKFTIDWNVNNGYNPYDATHYYPGSNYVDYIGVNAYDLDAKVYPYPAKCDAYCRADTQQKAWNENIFGGPRGLDFWSRYAAEHKKPLSLPEFGLWKLPDGSDGGADNPVYIERMHDFITWAPNHVAYAVYFNYDSPAGPHSVDSAFPDAGQDFRKLFGGKPSNN